MISERNQEFLEAIAFIIRTVATNDIVVVPTIAEKVNAMTLSTDDIHMICEALENEWIADGADNGVDDDAYIGLVNAVNCVPNKEYRLRRHDLSRAVNRVDLVKLKEHVAVAVAANTLIDPVEDDYRYISLLIRACTMLKDFEAMETIRRKMAV